ncbi:hypothetical protein JQ604_13800 [Bradyrhizobium jicamae]|uniref:hypothetical protein n=1 Tax=Bradyrhizobium jicamae TaxID=280332 RepID=UPI001BA7BA47|nr:hypothetical protein [Bradyrhizobium jicamae]MBR0753259.1 hypothetical protein [Bradyrhizobium jicamae]
MAINMAQKRAKKAQHRKQVVAEKRRVEAREASLPARIARFAQTPVQACYMAEGLFETGIGTLILARGNSSYSIGLGSFLIDVFCLGVKDVMLKEVDGDWLDYYVETCNASAPLIEIEPSYARKLLRDAAVWAQSIGFSPHPDFATVERIFGDVNPDDSDAVFQFGSDGKPTYISGPNETPTQIRRLTETLRKHLVEGAEIVVGPTAS